MLPTPSSSELRSELRLTEPLSFPSASYNGGVSNQILVTDAQLTGDWKHAMCVAKDMLYLEVMPHCPLCQPPVLLCFRFHFRKDGCRGQGSTCYAAAAC
ncbi:unnamed protein product [Dovyalis caffra]|uniref:Uncharacterized protein n=1 Tax=Dovyalis caffra TaxID=77055 RepID=A0AAV1RVZ4_9ROSI|nr:unnamed protein product [Dovyalis caffra]